MIAMLQQIFTQVMKAVLSASDNHKNNEVPDEFIEVKDEKIEWSHFVDNTRITSPYGWRTIFTKSGKQKKQFHNGTDYTGYNTHAKAPCDCVIEKVVKHDAGHPYQYTYNKDTNFFEYTNPPDGRAWTPFTVLRAIHDPNLKFTYRHGECLVDAGSNVWAGEPFYRIDSYGFSQGSHLHVEVKDNKIEKDPDKFITGVLNDS